MSKVIKVLLNQQDSKVENHLVFVAGQKKNDYYPEHEKREFQCGISVFYNDTYLLNFCLSEDEVELLKSDIKVKFIDDLSFILLTNSYNLTIMKNKGMSYMKAPENEIEGRIGALEEKQGYFSVDSYNEVNFTSENVYAFGKALTEAMNNPFGDFNITIGIPENAEEVVL